ncbi:MAG: FemAB family protein, partial [Mesoflavibacter sp.]|nr:FemAB family protein [Mesoflavibacter sp.]
MDYHKDRFEDYSLMVFKEEKLVAVLPANRVEDKLFSHQGLTYGGFVFCGSVNDINSLVKIISQVRVFFKSQNFKSLKIKLIPEFYYKQKHLYNEIIICFNEQVEETKMVFAVDLTKKLTIHKNKLKKYRNNKHHFIIDKSNQY